jgi:hypothetical protein
VNDLAEAGHARQGRRRQLLLSGLVVVVATALVGILVGKPQALWGTGPDGRPPPAGGYRQLEPTDSYAMLPDDAEGAGLVHRSSWEVRPGNAPYNRTVPAHLRLRPSDTATGAYDPRWNAYILGRVTGNFTGTTDEIFQWAAAKWGLPDDLLRAIALLESRWSQANFGDYVSDPARCPEGPAVVPCPVTFGIVGVKSTSWPGLFPWNRDSTAAAVDVLGGWLRGCYEGWVWWLRDHGNITHGRYAAGDLWGCAGAWFSGDWHDGAVGVPSGENYIDRAKKRFQQRPWLDVGF